jgi:hypothetical protein
MALLLAAVVAVLGFAVSLLIARCVLSGVLAWTYSGASRASSSPTGPRRRTPVVSSAARTV